MTRGDFALVTHPEHQPAVDFITRSSEGPFIDTGLDVQVRQAPGSPFLRERVYLSVHTVRQLASLVSESVQTPPERSLHEEKLIAQGKLYALKEGHGEHIARLAADLRAILDAAGIGDDAVAES